MADPLLAAALASLPDYLPGAIALRHEIHSAPSLAGEERATTDRIARFLGIANPAYAAEGMVAVCGPSGVPGVGIRAELDGLPIVEDSSVAWASKHHGAAHLCGHDVHAAALAAVFQVLGALELSTPLVAVFQPREETFPSGAIDVIASDTLRAQPLTAMLGVHLQPVLPGGTFSALGGAVNASADNFDIVISGRPAHGAYPHLSHDPVIAAGAVILALQSIVSRRTNPMNPAVVTIGVISGGDSPNAIPGEVSLRGTIRSHSIADRETIAEQVVSISAAIAEGYGCSAETTITLGEPILINDEKLAQTVTTALVGSGARRRLPMRSCGADDFSYYSGEYRSLMIFAGVGDAAPSSPGLHHPSFVPDDEIVGVLARIMLVSYFACGAD